jgi:hypothetical protein
LKYKIIIRQSQIRVGSNGGYDRTLLDTALEQGEGLIEKINEILTQLTFLRATGYFQ